MSKDLANRVRTMQEEFLSAHLRTTSAEQEPIITWIQLASNSLKLNVDAFYSSSTKEDSLGNGSAGLLRFGAFMCCDKS